MSSRFSYKIHCELIITSEFLTPIQITKSINIEPTRSYTKGDVFQSKNSGSVGDRTRNLWALKSDTQLTNDDNISPHIQFFINLFADKTVILKEIRRSEGNDASFWVWIECNELGIGTEISNDELSFLSEIVNRVHLTVTSTIRRRSKN